MAEVAQEKIVIAAKVVPETDKAALSKTQQELAKALQAASTQTSNTGSWKEMIGSIKKTTEHLHSFLAAIKRIAVYRLIRTALKEITQGFQEGIKNAYQWATVTGNQFAKSMDMMATSALYLKNSLGAMTMPLINTLAPIIDKITDKFVNLINVINQFIATITGATSWTKALKYPAQYLKQAAGSAKELKNQLLGFDELNVLNAPSSGGGAAGEDYSSMFQQMNLDTEIKKKLAKITAIVGGASLALGALLLPVKPKLGLGLLAIGAASLAASANIAWGTISNDLKSQLSVISAIASTSLLAMGILILPANPALGIGLLATGAIGLITTVALNWSKVVNFFKQGLESIKTLAMGYINGLIGSVIGFFGTIVSRAQGAWEGVKASVSAMWDALKYAGQAFFDWAVGKVAGFVSSFVTPIWNAIQSIKQWLNDVFGRTYTATVSSSATLTPHGGAGVTIDDRFTAFANGGFPEQGTMFIAGENGAEFVGNIGGRTGVYNTDQMASALASANEGVVEAVTAMATAVVSAINRKDMSLNVNDVRRALNSSNLRYGV